jgi:hypothetical protein
MGAIKERKGQRLTELQAEEEAVEMEAAIPPTVLTVLPDLGRTVLKAMAHVAIQVGEE